MERIKKGQSRAGQNLLTGVCLAVLAEMCIRDRDAQGNQYYTDGTEFAGLSSGSNNYAPSNPDLAARVEEDIAKFLERNPDVKREDIPTCLLYTSRCV